MYPKNIEEAVIFSEELVSCCCKAKPGAVLLQLTPNDKTMTHSFQPNLLNDQALVIRFVKQQDQRALLGLLQRHRSIISSALQRYQVDLTVEDMIHDLYLVLFDKLANCGDIRNFPAWLKTLVHNRLRDMIRKDGSRQKYVEYGKSLPQCYEARLDTSLDCQQIVDWAYTLVNEAEAECLVLRFGKDLSYKEIADELGLTFKQVCGRIDHGLGKMRREMRRVG